jgi:hypothetical protein
MISLVVKTSESPQKVIDIAVRYFGPNGLNMKIEEQNPESILFVKDNGNVEIVARKEDNTTSVEIVSREWEHQATEFTRRILPPVPQKQPFILWLSLALIAIGVIIAVVAWFTFGKVTGVVIGVIIAFVGVALNNIIRPRNR